MTLPFRRRHHDDEAAHDRARALTSTEMLEPLDDADASWLAGHLESCAECQVDREAFLADRALLRGLRAHTPEPPRDLWARTSAAIERESRTRRGRAPARTARARSLPFGAAAGALIVLVVIGASLIPPIAPPSSTPGNSAVGLASPEPQATTFEVTAGPVAYLRSSADGSWEFVSADVDGVCPRTRPSCRPLAEDEPGRPLSLAGTPVGVTISPNDDQLVVEAHGTGPGPDKIYVLPVPSASPAATPAPTAGATHGIPSGEPQTAVPATPKPTTPGPSPTPVVALEIASGVKVVGEAAYSADGKWLAFSARPSDGSSGPDLYLWTVGQPTAVAVTTDHRTYFSAWLGTQVLASRVGEPVVPAASDGPTAAPQRVEVHPSSFLLDPASLAETAIGQSDLWLPVVDPSGHRAAFWSGTLMPTADGLDWQLGTGKVVLSDWSSGPIPAATADPATPEPTAAPALGPTGTAVTVVSDRAASFQAKFDPSGTRLAVWVGEQLNADIGRLHLVVLDPKTGAIAEGPEPLAGTPALRRFSIGIGRLAWVTPSGQDGQDSTVQVLGWSSNDFGEIRSIPAKALYLVR
ncbi:MAG: PD40 domain-containing protein [Chloroflexi bacterium]|nr:PD40 domain-containing protein [Chloroflexota bacterium]